MGKGISDKWREDWMVLPRRSQHSLCTASDWKIPWTRAGNRQVVCSRKVGHKQVSCFEVWENLLKNGKCFCLNFYTFEIKSYTLRISDLEEWENLQKHGEILLYKFYTFEFKIKSFTLRIPDLVNLDLFPLKSVLNSLPTPWK